MGDNWRGRRLSEVKRPIEPVWLETLYQVARERGSAGHEIRARESETWYEISEGTQG